MPWHIAKSDSCPESKPWAVIKDSDGSVAGCHESEEAAGRQLAALYANENVRSSAQYEILTRSDAVIADVNKRQRLIDLIVVPWDQEAVVPWRGEVWRESFNRGAFDGIEDHAGRIRANREHHYGDTVGRAVSLDPKASPGLLGRLKIAATARGDDTLELAADDCLSASPGYYHKAPSDYILNRRTQTRRVLRAFLEHIGLVEVPAYEGARVLAVRAEQSGLAVADRPLPPAPALDDAMNDPVLQWAESRTPR